MLEFALQSSVMQVQFGRHYRHAAIIDIIQCAFDVNGFLSQLWLLEFDNGDVCGHVGVPFCPLLVADRSLWT